MLTTELLSRAVQQLDGVTLKRDQIQDWAVAGLITAKVPGIGGAPTLWDLHALAVVRLIVRLRRDIGRLRARVVVAQLVDELPQLLKPTSQNELFVDGYRAIIRRPGQFDEELPTHQLRLPLADVVKDNKRIAALVRAAA